MLTITLDDFQAMILRTVVNQAVECHENFLNDFSDDSPMYEEVQAITEALRDVTNQLGAE